MQSPRASTCDDADFPYTDLHAQWIHIRACTQQPTRQRMAPLASYPSPVCVRALIACQRTTTVRFWCIEQCVDLVFYVVGCLHTRCTHVCASFHCRLRNAIALIVVEVERRCRAVRFRIVSIRSHSLAWLTFHRRQVAQAQAKNGSTRFELGRRIYRFRCGHAANQTTHEHRRRSRGMNAR